MGACELHYAKIYSLGSGVAPQTVIPLYPICQQRCSSIPRMGTFELRMPKIIMGIWAGSANGHTSVSLWACKNVFGCIGMGCLNCTMLNILFGFQGGAPNTHTSVPPWPAQVCLNTSDGACELHHAKIYSLGSGVAPQTVIPLYPICLGCRPKH